MDFIVKRTDNIKEDLQRFLLNIVRREELYKVKVECMEKNLAQSFDEFTGSTPSETVIFTFKINSCFVFHKNLREVDRFCKELVNEVKNPMI